MMNVDHETVPADVFEMLEMTNKTAEEMFSLLDNLLKWTKSQLGKLSNVPAVDRHGRAYRGGDRGV